MISEKYKGLNQESFTINIQPETILEIDDISAYNQKEGLALSDEEIEYLENVKIIRNIRFHAPNPIKSWHLLDFIPHCINLKARAFQISNIHIPEGSLRRA